MRKNREDQVTVRANFLEVGRLHTFFQEFYYYYLITYLLFYRVI